jgi:hypothetical protein
VFLGRVQIAFCQLPFSKYVRFGEKSALVFKRGRFTIDNW